ncbi:UDP-3-O-(3-hydroxymyristoyl)glucosamine N-acyltransferase [Kovacikia minuta CCNUW1]|uniref:UDP-3-O-(3-hydroxymyristoyl)glucosamine N-acyltransferase n=1 Tax=Kovacikia minuta TaxID=2931930 RepID=UPI001CCE2331|nr:UDP-3-O-(3-hydroxymyristoyl)glucosamine N-acyltransferase [Kovacikia minuta]UBF26806.1 UDP-3-O-(3-hydroxymyristoyl)glucosamine N-acyltransferase [Kovacikia minuta CCNUW1]
MKFSQLVEKLNTINHHPLKTYSSQDLEITGIAALNEAISGTLSYIEGAKFASQVKTTRASALILPKDEALQAEAVEQGIAWIEATDPRLAFAQALSLFYQPFKPSPGIHSTAVIDPSAQIGQNVAIGAYTVIQAGVTIGDQVLIHPNVVVYPAAQIGDRTILHASCVIHERARIGSDCVIQAGAVIGSEGFGFVPTAEGWYKMEQSGYVVLEDGVEVGSNSTIDRPAVGETRIARNTKLDNLVHIGHGCQVGQNSAMAAQVGLAGGVKIGNRVMLGGQVGVANQAKVGDGAQIGAQAGVLSHVKPGDVVIGTPAMPLKTFLKVSALIPRLPELHRAWKEVQKRLKERPD